MAFIAGGASVAAASAAAALMFELSVNEQSDYRKHGNPDYYYYGYIHSIH